MFETIRRIHEQLAQPFGNRLQTTAVQVRADIHLQHFLLVGVPCRLNARENGSLSG
jgi:hypothetical protein